MLKISIPAPCHEDWEAMTPNEIGRHCHSCIKTVVDFTSMTDEEVKYFFINKKEEKICGRFRTEQLQKNTIELPENIFYTQLPFWKKFLAACLLVFSTTLFSCETKLNGYIVVKNEANDKTELVTLGKPVASRLISDTSVVSNQKNCSETVGTPSVIVGVIQTPPLLIDSNIIVGDTKASEDTLINKPAMHSPSEKPGEVIITPKDSLQTKNPPKADSNSCDTKIFS